MADGRIRPTPPSPYRGTELLGLAMIVGVVFFFALWHDIHRTYLSHLANQGTVYQALLINDGLKQEMHDHTGYIYYLLIAGWYRVLHAFSLLDVIRLSELPGPQSFEPFFADLVFAARWFSALLVAAFGVVFYAGLRGLTDNRAVAFAVTLLTVSSPGFVEAGAIMIRSDMTAMFFVTCAFFLTIAATGRAGWRGAAWAFGAGLCAWLGMASKMQVIPLLLTLPVFAFAFRRPDLQLAGRERGFDQAPWQWGFVFLSAAIALPALAMIWGSIVMYQSTGIYQSLIALYLIVAWLIYGAVYRQPWIERLTGLAAVVLGLSVAQYAHLITGDPTNSLAVANFLEWMSQYTHTHKFEGATLVAQSTSHLFDTVDRMIPQMFFEFLQAGATLSALYWLVGAGIVVAFCAGHRRLAVQAGLLWLTAFGMELFSAIKSWKLAYHIFVFPWLAVSGAVLVATLLRHRAAAAGPRPLLMLAVAGFAVCLAENVRQGVVPRALMPPENICDNAYGYLHRIPHHFDRYCPGGQYVPAARDSMIGVYKGNPGTDIKK